MAPLEADARNSSVLGAPIVLLTWGIIRSIFRLTVFREGGGRSVGAKRRPTTTATLSVQFRMPHASKSAGVIAKNAPAHV